MNCHEVNDKLCDYSADALVSTEAREIESHLEKCPPCLQEWKSLQFTLHSVSTANQSMPNRECSRQMWNQCLSHIEKKVELERLQSSRKTSWFQSPWLGWATLGSAFAFLASVLLTSPKTMTQPQAVDQTVVAPNSSNEWVLFQTPPRAATSYINHHAMMAFDPFADRVGNSLVADSAMQNPDVRISSIALQENSVSR